MEATHLSRKTGPICAPQQRSIDDVPPISYDVEGGVTAYMELMAAIIQRNNLIAPLRYCGVPVTPHRNPSCADAGDRDDEELQLEVVDEEAKVQENAKEPKKKKKKKKREEKKKEEKKKEKSKEEEKRRRSQYIIEDIEYEEATVQVEEPNEQEEQAEEDNRDGERGKKKSGRSYYVIDMHSSHDPSARVQLLVCDYDGYIVGIRRQWKGVWSSWSKFLQEYMPSWIDFTDISVFGNHSRKTTVGGTESIRHMFYVLARPDSSTADIKEALLRAVVMFCEALRFLSVMLLIIDAILNNQGATPLPNHIWARINNWGQLSKMVLQVGKNGVVDSPALLDRLLHKCQYSTFADIIGDSEQGDLTQLMRNDKILLDRATRESLQEEGAGEDVHDPGF